MGFTSYSLRQTPKIETSTEILFSLDPRFFQGIFDPVKFVLDEYPDLKEQESQAFLLEKLSFYDQCMESVRSELLTTVSLKTSELSRGLSNVQDVDMGLTRLSVNIRNARRKLASARLNMAEGDLKVLSHYRRRCRTRELNKQLHFVSNIAQQKSQVMEMADQGEILQAVKMCVALIQEIDKNPCELAIVKQMRTNLVKLLPSLRVKTDKMLGTVCGNKYSFSAGLYQGIVESYQAIDTAMRSTQDAYSLQKLNPNAMEQLVPRIKDSFIALSKNSFKDQLIMYLEDIENILGNEKEVIQIETLSIPMARGLSLEQLCIKLPNTSRTSVTPSFIRRIGYSFETICELANNFHLMCCFHQENQLPDLESFRIVFWKELLAVVSTVFMRCQLTRFAGIPNVKAFLNLIKLTELLAQFSQVFGGASCLLETRALIRDVCHNYVDDFYNEKLDILTSYLMRETWQIIHVPLSSIGGVDAIIGRGGSKHVQRTRSVDEDSKPIAIAADNLKLIRSMHEYINPFSELLQVPDEDEMVDENPIPENVTPQNVVASESNSFALTTTVINCVARDIGYFMDLMDNLPLSAADSFMNLKGIFQRYFYHIGTYFVTVQVLDSVFNVPGSLLSTRYHIFSQSMSSLRKVYNLPTVKVEPKKKPVVRAASEKVAVAMHIPASNIPGTIGGYSNSHNMLYASKDICQSIVAAESIRFAVHLLDCANEHFEELLPSIAKEKLSQQVFGDLKVLSDQIVDLVYITIAKKLLRQFIPNISIASAIEWHKLNTLQTEATQYVDTILKGLTRIRTLLQRESSEGSVYPLDAISTSWDFIAAQSFDDMLHGFATVSSCSTEGRALMSLDLATLFRGIKDIGPLGLKGNGARDKVDAYIKAFYYDRTHDVVDWIRLHKEQYEPWQLRNLAMNGVYGSLKSKGEKNALVSTLDNLLPN